MDVNNDSIEDKETEENLNGIPVAEDEPIYAISDFEGRYDYYIRFLMDIGFLDKEKLKNIITNNCNNEEEEKKICEAFFNGNPEDFFNIACYYTHNEDEKQKYIKHIQQNKTRLEWLIKHFTTNVIKQVINKDFKGKIVVNGDLYSDRLMVLLMNRTERLNWPDGERTISCENVKKLTTDINTSCYDLLKTLNEKLNSDEEDESFFLIAGNHDLYACDVTLNLPDKDDCLKDIKNHTLNFPDKDDYLKDIKNHTLQNLSLLKFAKFKKGDKTIVFKHSPHLNEKDLERIKSNESQHIRDKIIRQNIKDKDRKEPKHSYYWKYANNQLQKYDVNEERIFCDQTQDNENINKQLQKNNYYMVFGHCGITESNSSTFSIIDKRWDRYRYSKFSIDKKQLKHEVYGAENKRITIFNIANFEKTKRRDEKFNNKKLSIVPNNKIYFQKQKKNLDVLQPSEVDSFSINNKVPKRDMGSQTEHEMEFQYQPRSSLNKVDRSNSYSNSCCNKIYNICG